MNNEKNFFQKNNSLKSLVVDFIFQISFKERIPLISILNSATQIQLKINVGVSSQVPKTTII